MITIPDHLFLFFYCFYLNKIFIILSKGEEIYGLS